MKFPKGQESIVNFFKTQIQSDRLVHAYLLCGDSGCGKKTVCNYLLHLIMCKSHTACGLCNGCATVESGANPDIMYISNGDKLSIGVDDVRNVTTEVFTKPIISEKKIVVIQNAHLMTQEAQNALLKVIEEPPGYVVFFLLCDSVSTILSTILSRVTKIEIPPVDIQTLREIAPGCDEFMYRYCGGNPGKLLELKDDEEFAKLRDESVSMVMCLCDSDSYSMYSYESYFGAGNGQTAAIYDLMLIFVRDCLLKKNGVDELIVNQDKINDIKAFCTLVSTKKCAQIADIITKSRREIGASQSSAMSWQSMFIKCREVIYDRSSRNTL